MNKYIYVSIVILVSTIIFFKQKKDIYLILDKDMISDNKSDIWKPYRYLFPSNFNPYNSNSLQEIIKLNKYQKQKFDSISNIIYQKPIIIKYPKKKLDCYSIFTDNDTEVELCAVKQTIINVRNIKKTDLISLNKFLELIPHFYINFNNNSTDVNFHILEKDNENYIVNTVNPKVILYD